MNFAICAASPRPCFRNDPAETGKNFNQLGGQGHESFLDPFCGSGTFLMEAALLGFSKICGSDASDKAVADTKENMEWLQNFYKVNPKIELKMPGGRSAEMLVKKIRLYCHRAISRPPVRGELAKHKAIDCSKNLARIMKNICPGLARFESGRMPGFDCPVFYYGKGQFFPALKIKRKRLPKPFAPSILYSRSDQKVGREIFILKKYKTFFIPLPLKKGGWEGFL